MNCADEHMGIIDNDPKIEKHLGYDWDNSVFNLTTQILKESDQTKKTPQKIAVELAEARSFEVNVLYGHRSKVVIDWLIDSQEWKNQLYL